MDTEVKWIKLTTDMFDNRKIKYLRTLPEGNSIVLIWVMLLTMAGRCNAGGMIFLTENIPYNAKILADELGFDMNIVNVALRSLTALGMINTVNGQLTISNWDEYQNIEGMERIREQNRLRKQAQREREKLESHVTSRDGHVTVTHLDKEKDIEKEKEIDKSKVKRTFVPPTIEDVSNYCKERNNSVDPNRFVDYYTSNGWMVGRNKMKDWKAAVRNWEKDKAKETPKEEKKFDIDEYGREQGWWE